MSVSVLWTIDKEKNIKHANVKIHKKITEIRYYVMIVVVCASGECRMVVWLKLLMNLFNLDIVESINFPLKFYFMYVHTHRF